MKAIKENGQLYDRSPTKKITYEFKRNVFEIKGAKDLGPMPK